jgi:hypothetical protein
MRRSWDAAQAWVRRGRCKGESLAMTAYFRASISNLVRDFRNQMLACFLMVGSMAGLGCGFIDGVFPESASERGTKSIGIYTGVSGFGTRALPDGVTDIRLEFSDVLVAPQAGDAWYLLLDRPVWWTLSDPEPLGLAPAYLPKGKYDAVRVLISDAEIEVDGEWQHLYLDRDEIEIEEEVELKVQSLLDFELALDDALARDEIGRWQLVVQFRVVRTTI